MEEFDVPGASDALAHYLDLLTNWYVRTQRDRFWEEDADAFDTLYTVLETVTRLAAPLLPLETEEIWRGLTGGRSVHLTDYPVAPVVWADDSLGATASLKSAMDQVREVVSVAHALRKKEQLRVRQPLASLDVAVPRRCARGLRRPDRRRAQRQGGAVADDRRVHRREPRRARLTVNARAAGPRIGKYVQQAIAGSKSGDWSEADGVVTSGGIALEEGEYDLATVIGGEGDDAVAAAVLPGGGFVVLDTTLTPELEAEGYARDLVRAIQDERKARRSQRGRPHRAHADGARGSGGRGRGAPSSSSRTRCSRRPSPSRQETLKGSPSSRRSQRRHWTPRAARVRARGSGMANGGRTREARGPGRRPAARQ